MRVWGRSLFYFSLISVVLLLGCSESNTSAETFGNTIETAKTEVRQLVACDEIAMRVEILKLSRCGTTGSVNQAPTVSEVIFPGENRKISVRTPKLEWKASDPDGDALLYEVRLGEDPAELAVISGFHQSVEYLRVPERLRSGHAYYWQVVADDQHGHQVAGPVWSFRTQSFPHSLVFKTATE